MATIRSATLESSKSSRSVLFQASVDMRFESRELNSQWELRMNLLEDDNIKDDKLGRETRVQFRPSQVSTRLPISKRLSKSTVDTEWGDEEVYGRITLVPLESPRPFATASANTGIEVVNE